MGYIFIKCLSERVGWVSIQDLDLPDVVARRSKNSRLHVLVRHETVHFHKACIEFTLEFV